jgi:assimilatory nitrate reductase catalytic subunit
VVGFEPWEEFPFNRGMLCPKGVKRYLQNEHPDRLKSPLRRTDAGFQPVSWDDALDFTAAACARSRRRTARTRSPSTGGIPHQREVLPAREVRAGRSGTRHIDYNGRLCMVSAGTPTRWPRDRPLAEPLERHPKAQVRLVTGPNVAECAPITTDYSGGCATPAGS